MSRDIFLRPLAEADAFVHSAPNLKQRSRSEVDRLGPRATGARLRIPIPSGFMPAVLHRPPWLNVDQLNLPLLAPAQEVPAGQFRTVVTANRFRFSPTFDHTFQRPRHSTAR